MPPRRARILLGGAAKTGKTTTLGEWAPQTTLIVDTQNGTHLLDGEHYVQHVRDWPGFVATVQDICAGGHPFHTIGLDLTNDLWAFCDLYYGRRDKDTGLVFPASSQDDYGRSSSKARAGFKNTMGRLLAAPVGVWFLTHLQDKTDKEGKLTVYRPDLDKNVYAYISGAADFVWLAEVVKGGQRVLHTQPTPHFEAGSRGPANRPMPSPLALNVREIALALDRVLNPQKYDDAGQPVQDAAEPETPELVPPSESVPVDETAPPNTKDIGHDPEATDVPAEDVWWTETEALMVPLKLTSADLRDALAQVPGVVVPERVGSWQKLITSLDPEQRVTFRVWLEQRAMADTPIAVGTT
jgi:hypothetical protein